MNRMVAYLKFFCHFRSNLSLLLIVALSTLLFLAGCSGGDIPAPEAPPTDTTDPTDPDPDEDVVTRTMGDLVIGTSPLSPYASTSISVTVLDDGVATTSAVSVQFTSVCAASGNATITSSSLTVSGVATAIYTDNGCGSSDIITASVTDGPSQTGTIVVTPLTMGALTYGANPISAFESTTVSVELFDGTSYFNYPTTVAFSSTCATSGLATITPSVNNSGGVAVATYVNKGCVGIDYITVSLPSLNNSPTQLGMTLTATPLTMSAISFGSPTPLSPYTSTTVSVTVYDGAAAATIPLEVIFGSTCVTTGKAQITDKVTTINGVATANYTDIGCGTSDFITAFITNGPSANVTLPVNALTLNDMTFGSNPMSAFGSNTIQVTLREGVSTNYLIPTEVKFESTCAKKGLATITSSAYSNAGIAQATYIDQGCTGIDTITASDVDHANVVPISGYLNINSITMSALTFGSSPLSAYDETTVSVSILEGGSPTASPVEVEFTSTCASAGTATIDPSTYTVAGIATVNYTDLGCGKTDTIVATVPGIVQQSGNLPVYKLTLENLTTTTVAPYSTADISVDLVENGAAYTIPTTVIFETSCAEGTITPEVNTDTGTATATFKDENGCAGLYLVTVKTRLANGPTKTGSFTVNKLEMSALTLGTLTLPAYTSTTVKVTLLNGAATYTTPTSVRFDSQCASTGQALISPQPVQTVSGVATVTYTDNGCTGDDIITASTPNLNNGPKKSATIGISQLVLDNPLGIAVNPLSAYGTTSVVATVRDELSGATITSPLTVTFSSNCATNGTATLTSTANTNNGVATATYTDNGCNNTDYIKATLPNGTSVTTSLVVQAPGTGSLQFISATPETIALRGTGGVVSSDYSDVLFKVLDTSGSPLQGKTVNFTLSTTIGGLSFSNGLATASTITDLNGEAIATVHSGTISTPIRVTASTVTDSGTTISSQSEQLWISTGLPDYDSFSISADSWRVARLWEYDGETVTITIRPSDHFGNPVPDGTTISFISECGQIDPSCLVSDGACQVNLVSASPRASDGQCAILAYAIGEESFSDADGDGVADAGEFTNIGEPWLDTNSNGVYDAGEFYADYDSNGTYSTAATDPLFNGVLCDDSATGKSTPTGGVCSAQDMLYVYRNPVMIWSTALVGATSIAPATHNLINCTDTETWTLHVEDLHANPMADGTTISISDGEDGLIEILGASSWTTNGDTDFTFTTRGTDSCVNNSSDLLEVTVTSPGSLAQVFTYPFSIPALTMNAMTFADNPLSAYETTSLSVTVEDSASSTPTALPLDVNFTSPCVLSGKATVTDTVALSGGTATAIYTDKGCGTTDQITASIENGPSVSGNLSVNTLTIGAFTYGAEPLNAYGTTTITAPVLDGALATTKSFTVNFTSTCSIAGKATIGASATTVGGDASVNYTDLGCGGTDTITASIADGPTKTDTLDINALTLQNLTSAPDPISPFTSATVSVDLYNGAALFLTPTVVNFASTCSSAANATITTSSIAYGGTATTLYTDNGCQGDDLVTVTIPSLTNGPTLTDTISINKLTLTNMTFGTSPLLSLSSTTVSVDLLEGAATPYSTPTLVSFNSICSGLGLATISATAYSSGGTATATYTDKGCPGPDTITASVTLKNVMPLSGNLTITPKTIDPLVFGTAPLGAYDTTTVKATVMDGVLATTDIVTVNFSSTCSAGGKATIGANATTVNGVATVNYTDFGCGATDTITASVTNGPSQTGTLVVYPLTMENVTYLPAEPLSPYGSTTISVDLVENGGAFTTSTPLAVNFESTCAAAGNATINQTVNTITGTATTTYTDNGCGEDDWITITVPSLTNGPSVVDTLTITPLTLSSLVIAANPITAYESTSVAVTLKNGAATYTTPTSVLFQSQCSAAGLATISPQPVQTISGVATITYTDNGCTGDDVITVTLPGLNNPPTTSDILVVDQFQMSAITFGAATLSAYGTTSVAVDITAGNPPAAITTPVAVNFTSHCVELGTASITPTVMTNTGTGTATASYTDNGCNGTDWVTASITNGPSTSASLTVEAPDIGSLQFVSATPSTIALKGSGGVGSSDTSQVRFKVLDPQGNPLEGKTVNFVLTTEIGGLFLTSASGITNSSGEVDAIVNSGTIGTPVRVTASTVTAGGTTLYSQSEQLWVSTGLPDQDSFSLSTPTWYLPKFNEIDGETAVFTIIASDHFNNPVPDGTTIYFTTECGQIEPSCQISGGTCNVTLTSAGVRPADGNCGILAYAIGEESFSDADGDGVADAGEFTNIGEPWLDANGNGVYDAGEFFADFDTNGVYSDDTVDPLFNGGLCDDSATGNSTPTGGVCSSRTTTYVFRNPVVYWPTELYGSASPNIINLVDCTTPSSQTLHVEDENGNPMASETTFSLANDTGNLEITPSTFTASDGLTIAAGNNTDFDFDIIGSGSCVASSNETIVVTITPPGGEPQYHYITVIIP